MQSAHLTAIVAALGLASFIACAETPTGGAPVKTRAMKGGTVDAGHSSIESERRRLQGTWELTALQVFSPTGEPLAAQASGRLQYDEFGNLAMRGTVTGGP